jgi:hypothetical protein
MNSRMCASWLVSDVRQECATRGGLVASSRLKTSSSCWRSGSARYVRTRESIPRSALRLQHESHDWNIDTGYAFAATNPAWPGPRFGSPSGSSGRGAAVHGPHPEPQAQINLVVWHFLLDSIRRTALLELEVKQLRHDIDSIKRASMKLGVRHPALRLEVAGGAEAHCRGLATALSARHQVEISHLRARLHHLEEPLSGGHRHGRRLRSRAIATARRTHRRFAAISDLVFRDDAHADDERRWIVENGRCRRISSGDRDARDIDLFLFYSFRYYSAAMGAGGGPRSRGARTNRRGRPGRAAWRFRRPVSIRSRLFVPDA